jgi:hypothetical protein
LPGGEVIRPVASRVRIADGRVKLGEGLRKLAGNRRQRGNLDKNDRRVKNDPA